MKRKVKVPLAIKNTGVKVMPIFISELASAFNKIIPVVRKKGYALALIVMSDDGEAGSIYR